MKTRREASKSAPSTEPSQLETLDRVLFELISSSVRVEQYEFNEQIARRTGFIPTSTTMALLDRLGTGAMRVNELSAQIGITPSAITRQVQYLEKKGLIDRASDPSDKRATNVRLSAKGLEVLDAITELRLDSLRQTVSGWSAEDVDRAIDILQRLQRGLR